MIREDWEVWAAPDDSLRTAGILAGDRVLIEPIAAGSALVSGSIVLARHGRGSRVLTTLFRVEASIRGAVALSPLSGVGRIMVAGEDVLARAVGLVRSLDGTPQRNSLVDEVSPSERIARLGREMGKRDEILGKCLLTIAAAAAVGGVWLEKLAVVLLAEGQVLVDHVFGADAPRTRVH